MSDNTTINPGSGGDVIATDDLTSLNGGVVSGQKVQRVKVGYGSDGSLRDIDTSNGLPIQGTQSSVSTAAWTSATTLNTANSISVVGYNTVSIAMSNTSTMTGGVLTFEVSPDNSTWFPIAMARIDSFTVETTYTLNTVANRAWSTSVDGFTNFRVRLSTVITGTGTATIDVTAQTFAIEPIVNVGLPNPAALTDADANPTVPGTGSYLMGWTASVWRRLRADTSGFLFVRPSGDVATFGDANTMSAATAAGNWVLNGSGTWDRLRSAAATTGTTGTGLLGSAPQLIGTTNYSSQRAAIAISADADTGIGVPIAAGLMFNGTNYDRARSAQATGLVGVAAVSQRPNTLGGNSIYRLLSAATTNANNIKASAGQVYGWSFFNTSASTKFVKLYNKATAPTVGTDTPVMTLPIPPGGGSNIGYDSGIAFATGISIAVTGVVTDADTTAVAANDVIVNLFYT